MEFLFKVSKAKTLYLFRMTYLSLLIVSFAVRCSGDFDLLQKKKSGTEVTAGVLDLDLLQDLKRSLNSSGFQAKRH